MTTKEAISLINNKHTTIDEICANLFSHVESFQQSREDFYMDEFESTVTDNPESFDVSRIDEYTDSIFSEIARDTRQFVKEYTIKQGDTITTIAKKYKLSTERLIKINNIKDVNKIQVGQKLKFM